MANKVSQFTFEQVERKLEIVRDDMGADKCLLGNGSYGTLPTSEKITLDELPTEGSENAVKSGGVFSALEETQAENQNYTDEKAEEVKQYADTKAEEAKGYADTKAEEVSNYTDELFNTLTEDAPENMNNFKKVSEAIQTNSDGLTELNEAIKNQQNTNKYEKFVVVCVAGQSNAVGYDESPVDEKFTYSNLDNDRIKQLGFYGDQNLQLIDLGYCAQNMQDMRVHNRPGTETAGTKGIHLPLANLMLDYIPDDYGVLVLPISFGGTGFTSGIPSLIGTYNADTKKPNEIGAGQGTTGQRWGVDTPYYNTLKDRIIHALQLNEENLFAGIVWCQGENDKNDAAGHYTAFQEMTQALFTALNDAGLGARVPKGTWDKDIWYNMETVSHWYSVGQCQQIWDNYKLWNKNTYVEIPRDTDSNAINGTGQTASNRPDHYGNNAYQKVVAPRVLQKMIDMNTFAKKVNIVEPEIEIPVIDNNNEGGEKVLEQSDITTRSSIVFTISDDGDCTADQDLQGKFQVNSEEQPCVYFGEIHQMEWDVTRGMYWVIIEGDITGNFLLLGLGGNMTGQLAKIENGALSVVENANQHSAWHYSFAAGDKVRIVRNADGSLTTYRTNGGNGIFQKWFDYSNRNIYEKKAFGFACGIAGNEFTTSPFNTEKRILFNNMIIQKNEDVQVSIAKAKVKSITLTTNADGAITGGTLVFGDDTSIPITISQATA